MEISPIVAVAVDEDENGEWSKTQAALSSAVITGAATCVESLHVYAILRASLSSSMISSQLKFVQIQNKVFV